MTDAAMTALGAASAGRPSGARVFFSRLGRSKVGTLGFVMFASVLAVAVAAPWLAPHDPREIALEKKFLPPVSAGGAASHPLGTDQLGRDVLSGVVYGARTSLVISVLSVSGAFSIGVTAGLVAGFYGGGWDPFFMRVVDILQAMPSLVVLLALIGVLGPHLSTIILVFSMTGWGGYARVVRGEVLSVKRREYADAARAIGLAEGRILRRHILPNVLSAALALAALALGSVIIAESALSYLGLSADVVTWGRMLAGGREYVVTAWWLAVFPGVAIVYTVLGVVFFGDWLRDYIDPRIRGRY
jgi:peptide/nickel transport system permease protein